MTNRWSLLAALLAFLMPTASSVAEADSAPPPATDVSRQGGTLSDKLGATDGVIHPEGAPDPGMAKPAPPVGSMPVIPPSDSPGVAPGDKPK